METAVTAKSPNSWKELDLTAKYAQINTLRKIACDIAFVGITQQLNTMVEMRVLNLTGDLLQLHRLDNVAAVELPKPE